MERNVVGEAGEREREREGWLRGEGRCSAELERTPRAQPSARCHGNHIPPPPASLQTALSLFYCLSISLSSPSMLFIPLLICVSVSLYFFRFYSRRTRPWRRTLSRHIGFDAVRSLCQGEWVIAPFIVHSSAHGHISIALFSQHLSIFTPPSVQQRASAMPPLVIASAHTQGTLVSFLQSFEPCHGPIAPFFGFYTLLLPSWQSPHLFKKIFAHLL